MNLLLGKFIVRNMVFEEKNNNNKKDISVKL